jgi:HSP20 family protein
MLTLRHSSPFDVFERLEQQLQTAERVPSAEVHESEAAYEVVLELPGVDRAAIDVKATDRSLLISAERRQPESESKALMSEFRYGTWSRRFRFPKAIDREHLEAHYRDVLLTVKAPKTQVLTTVSVKVEG